jgi:o-succinylbenzoate synthase
MIRLTRLVEQHLRFVDEAGDPAAARDAVHTWSDRQTLLLVIEDGDGGVGIGEAAPLPDYSPESLDDAWNALAPLVGTELGRIELGAAGSSRELLAVSGAITSRSARFAFETAMLDLWSRRRAEPAWALLGRVASELFRAGEAPEVVSLDEGRAISALLPNELERALRHAKNASARGIRCFKAKIGAQGAWSEELALLRAVRQRFPEAGLRVDANRSLSPEELWQRLPALRELGLEWLEEPVRRFPQGIEWPVDVPLALDESLQAGLPDERVMRAHGVRAVVLKPTTLGGFVRTFELAERARSAGLAVVVSHAYEGPVGFSALAALSLALGPSRPADGLDRHPGVADTPALPGFDAETSRIRAWLEPGFGHSLAALLEKRPPTRELRA